MLRLVEQIKQAVAAFAIRETPSETVMGSLRVVGAEGLIGFKLQALTNDPSRTRDMEDIRALLRAQRGSLDMREVEGYFALFDQMEWFNEIVAEIGHAPY